MILNARRKDLLIALGGIALFAALVAPPNVRPTQDYDRFERIAAALEAYAVDNAGNYPPHQKPGDIAPYYLPDILTTPIAYLSDADLHDPLTTINQQKDLRFRYLNVAQAYAQQPSLYSQVTQMYGDWIVWSPGFDKTTNFVGGFSQGPLIYDATNGTISFGDMVRSQIMQTETGQ